MNIQEALDMVDKMKPNMMDQGTKIKFLSEIEGLIHHELRLKHVHKPEEHTCPKFDEATDPGTELMVPDPYAMVYVYWVMAKIDLRNLEIDKYNNDNALFASAYNTLSDWWTRTRMPISEVRELRL